MSLDKEFQYYIDHQDELLKKYRNKFLVIKNGTVKGAFNNIDEAYTFAVKNYELGTFLLQECTPGEDSYTETFHSRAIFY